MSSSRINKVDMSLDDIIKVERAEKRKQAKAAKLQSMRGARGATRGVARGATRGVARGATRGTVSRGRGRGRGVAVAVSALRGGLRGAGRARGRGTQNSRLGKAVQVQASVNRQRGGGGGRGRGRPNLRGRGSATSRITKISSGQQQQVTQIFTNSGRGRQHQKNPAAQQQNQRLNTARRQAALLREKQLALKNLEQAKRNMQTVTLAIQKSSRDSVVNQMRGLGSTGLPTAKTNGRGRRKLLASVTRTSINGANLNSNAAARQASNSSRQLNYTTVTVTNPAALTNTQPAARGGRRQWRKPRLAAAPPPDAFVDVKQEIPIVTHSVQPSSVLDKLKALKPAVHTTYKFQKNVFAAPTTGIRLSDRFAASSSGGEGRKVFV